MTITVLLADDQDLVRTGLKLILDAFLPEILVVGVAHDGQEAVTMANALRPDVCLFDIQMPRLDGIEATKMVAGPDVADPLTVVMLTTFDLDDYIFRSLQAGARGFLLKDTEPELLVEAIRTAASGEALISPVATSRLLNKFASSSTDSLRKDNKDISEPLSPREEETLLLVAEGLTNNEIVERLHVSLSTVKSRISMIMLKIGVRNRVEIAIWAYQTGRIRLD